jgi:hypothetical protein
MYNSRLIRVKKLGEMVNTKLADLIDWVQQSTYSPDHLVGNLLMKSAETNFKNFHIKNLI